MRFQQFLFHNCFFAPNHLGVIVHLLNNTYFQLVFIFILSFNDPRQKLNHFALDLTYDGSTKQGCLIVLLDRKYLKFVKYFRSVGPIVTEHAMNLQLQGSESVEILSKVKKPFTRLNKIILQCTLMPIYQPVSISRIHCLLIEVQ